MAIDVVTMDLDVVTMALDMVIITTPAMDTVLLARHNPKLKPTKIRRNPSSYAICPSVSVYVISGLHNYLISFYANNYNLYLNFYFCHVYHVQCASTCQLVKFIIGVAMFFHMILPK
jgi:hypothetical protein